MSNPGVATPAVHRRIAFSFQSLGWRRATQELITARRPYDPARDTSFDDRHGTDTAGSVAAEDLGIDDEERRQQAILYLPSPLRVTNWMFDHVDVEPSTCTFVDLGCGKGRVLLVAAQRPFCRVVGFEISVELAALAQANATRYRPPPVARAPIEVVNADVTTVDLPATDLLIHLYHPFETNVSAAVLGRLEASLASIPRHVTIAYLAYTAAVEPVAEMFARFPWLRLIRYEQSIRGHYNWMIYAN